MSPLHKPTARAGCGYRVIIGHVSQANLDACGNVRVSRQPEDRRQPRRSDLSLQTELFAMAAKIARWTLNATATSNPQADAMLALVERDAERLAQQLADDWTEEAEIFGVFDLSMETVTLTDGDLRRLRYLSAEIQPVDFSLALAAILEEALMELTVEEAFA